MYQFTSIHDHISFKELSKIWMYISSRKQGYFHAVWRLPFHQPQLYLKNLINMAFLVAQMVRICLQSRRPGFDPWVRKISWRREWQPTLVFLPPTPKKGLKDSSIITSKLAKSPRQHLRMHKSMWSFCGCSRWVTLMRKIQAHVRHVTSLVTFLSLIFFSM